MPLSDRERLREIKTFPSLVKYLRDDLGWPIEAENFDDLTFDYEPEELGLDAETAAKVEGIKQLRPLVTYQPWGIFFIKFEPKRLPVMALRRILSQLVMKKRVSARKAEQKLWGLHDLLFISNYGEGDQRQITFAHFAQEEGTGDLPTLRVLGWDDADTALHIDHVHEELKDKLRWPEDGETVDQWRTRWSSVFTLRHREVITTSKDMSQRLAQLATEIRKRVNTILRLESERGPLRKLQVAFKETLIHDLSDDDFADMYAQTITYGLLTARVSRPAGIVAENVADMVPVTNPFLRDMLSTFLTIGGRKGKIDFDEVGINDVVQTLRKANMEGVLRDFGDRRPEEDPVIFFYEDFLKAYDAKKKVQRGVFYTPQPVVSHIVRSVHELLQKEFGLEYGLADTTTWGEMVKKHNGLVIPKDAKPTDPFVQILDPAVGTGTFLVEAIDVIQRTMTAKWQSEGLNEKQRLAAWNDYVPKHLLPRLHGYELMMAPYAIAHMKVGLKLYETGYRFGSDERARIYLTNSLEPPSDIQPGLEGLSPALAHEAKAVNDVKRNKRFTVVIGNPPYSNYGQLNRTTFILDLLEDYKRGLEEKKLNLDDDFIKFIRYSQYLMSSAGVGVFGMITNNTFLDGVTHRRMRETLLGDFNRLSFVNLHGSSRRQERNPNGGDDKNVFDIQTGVTISLLSKLGTDKVVNHLDLWGTREYKYAQLQTSTLGSMALARVSSEPPYFFLQPKSLDLASYYHNWLGLKEVFSVSGCGVKTERDHVSIHWTLQECQQAVEEFRTKPESHLREKYNLGHDSRDWKVANAKEDVIANRSVKNFRRILYRPFDVRYIWYSGQTRGFIGTPGFPTMRHMLDSQNLALLACRQQAELGFQHVFCSSVITECCAVSLKTREITSVFPLYVRSSKDSLALHANKSPNLSEKFLGLLAVTLQASREPPYGMPKGLTPEDVFNYVIAVLHSPNYRNRYAEFLKIDFPRLPLTSSLDFFRALAKLGGELVALHLMESLKLDKHITKWLGKTPSGEVEKVTYSDETVWIDKAKTEGFRGVPDAVWNFHIGGYQVCEKWLKDRKRRRLSADDTIHYQKIVVALNETIRLMAEIDKVIENHGGWPGAFVTSQPAAT